jgi:hypothetical protein
MNCKGFGRKQLWPNFKVLPRHSPGRTERYHENISQDSRSEDRDSNAGPTECEAGVLTTWPRRPIVRVVLGRYYWTEIAPETFSAGRPQIPNFILSSSVLPEKYADGTKLPVPHTPCKDRTKRSPTTWQGLGAGVHVTPIRTVRLAPGREFQSDRRICPRPGTAELLC